MENHESEIKALISLFDDNDEVFSHVRNVLIGKHGKKALPFLYDSLKFSNEFNELTRERIQQTIADIRQDSLASGLKNWAENGAIDLTEGLFWIAQTENPTLTLDGLRGQLDELVFEAWRNYKYAFSPTEQIYNLNRTFFQELGFKPNINHFHLPENSMLDKIIEKRTSNPIGLCIIYAHIAQSLKFPVYGVNLPNLFVLTYKSPQVQFYINVFNLGVIFSKHDIENYLLQMRINPAENFFEPCGNLDIVRRVLNNLLLAYEKTAEAEKYNDIKKVIRTVFER
jgi:regulator of sirC expression with transglutaminase-like and TPR domain